MKRIRAKSAVLSCDRSSAFYRPRDFGSQNNEEVIKRAAIFYGTRTQRPYARTMSLFMLLVAIRLYENGWKVRGTEGERQRRVNGGSENRETLQVKRKPGRENVANAKKGACLLPYSNPFRFLFHVIAPRYTRDIACIVASVAPKMLKKKMHTRYFRVQ